MNISNVINDIKFTNGLNEIATPYKQPIELVIKKILETSIRTFSHLKQYEKEGTERIENLRSPSEYAKRQGIFFLPESLTTTPVRDAYAVPTSGNSSHYEAAHSTNTFTVGSPFVGFGSYYPQDIINATTTGAAINKYAGITSREPSSHWLGENKIQLCDFPSRCMVAFTVKCDHDPNGETIPESQVLSFMQLATLDVQRTLYNQLKNMMNVGSGFKEYRTKIEEWAGAQEKYDALIEKWEGRFHLDDLDLVQFF